MILSKIIQGLYAKIYISIIASHSGTLVCTHILKGNKTKERFSQRFEGSGVTQDLVDYVHNFTKETPFYYISLLDCSVDQGALPTCKHEKFADYRQMRSEQTICHGSWTSFSSKQELFYLQKRYASFGLDFIFSPFTVLERFFKDKVDTNATLFALIQEDSVAIAVF